MNFDDPVAYERRWGRLTRDQEFESAASDPLLYLADHMALDDRRPGAIGLFSDLPEIHPTWVVIPDGDPDLDEQGCFNAIAAFVAKLCEDNGLDTERASTEEIGRFIGTFGMVHHRRGGHHVTDLDRWWASAVAKVCLGLGIEPLGVIARTQSGAIVRVPLPPDAMRRAG